MALMEALVLWLISLITLTNLAGEPIIVSSDHVVAFAEPREEGTIKKGGRCVINLADGKFISVKETCMEVYKKIDKAMEQKDGQHL